jgi:hypothetical protein
MSVFRASNTPETDWSVPVQRGPYPAGYPDPEGPTERLFVPDDEPEPLAEPEEPFPEDPDQGRRRAVLTALIIAALALLASGTAVGISVHALRKADDARSMMTMHRPVPPPTRPPTTTGSVVAPPPAVSGSPVPSSGSTASPSVSPSGPLIYAQEPVRVTVDCGETALIDLDGPKPRQGAPEAQADLRYDNRCGGGGSLLAPGPGALAGSHVTDPDTDRPGCADALATNPLEAGDSVPVQKGTVLCVATAGSLSLVEVTGLGDEGVVSLRITGWTAPHATDSTGPTPSAGS